MTSKQQDDVFKRELEDRNQSVPTIPTAAELRLLKILWERGEATVEEIVNAHSEEARPNYKTTQTLLRIMERKGYIAHESRGRAFIFTPSVSREIIDKNSVKALLNRNFGGSPAGLFVNLLESAAIQEEDLEAIESQIREYRSRLDGKATKAGSES